MRIVNNQGQGILFGEIDKIPEKQKLKARLLIVYNILIYNCAKSFIAVHVLTVDTTKNT